MIESVTLQVPSDAAASAVASARADIVAAGRVRSLEVSVVADADAGFTAVDAVLEEA